MSYSSSPAAGLSVLVGLAFMVGWVVWGVRQYRRTGQAQWLWMAVALGFGLAMGAVTYLSVR